MAYDFTADDVFEMAEKLDEIIKEEMGHIRILSKELIARKK